MLHCELVKTKQWDDDKYFDEAAAWVAGSFERIFQTYVGSRP